METSTTCFNSKDNPAHKLPATLDPHRILNVEQVASLLNYSVVHIRRLYNTGKIPAPIKIGGRKLGWRAGVILDLIAAAPGREAA